MTIHVALVRSYDKNIVKTYKGKDCIQRFCDDLYELGMKAVNAPKKRMNELTEEENELIDQTNHCHFCDEEFC